MYITSHINYIKDKRMWMDGTTYIILIHFLCHFNVLSGDLWDTVLLHITLFLSLKALLLIKNKPMEDR